MKTRRSKKRIRKLEVIDYFAAAALTGLIADNSTNEYTQEELCNSAYAYASAMIEAKDRYESLKIGEIINPHAKE